jgi:hypothetical protein
VAGVVVLVTLFLLWHPGYALSFLCEYPTQRLIGLADVGGDRFVRLDLSVKIVGPECEVVIAGGRFQCSPVGVRTLGVRFTPPARGRCPGSNGEVMSGTYARRVAESTIADVVVESVLENGTRCTISGVSAAARLGGPLPSLLGTLSCVGPSGEIVAKGPIELLRRPLPPL